MEKLISSDGNINLKYTFILLFKKKFLILITSLIFSIVYIGINASKVPVYNYSIKFSSSHMSMSEFFDKMDPTKDIFSNIKNIENIRKTLIQNSNIDHQKTELDTLIYKVINQINYKVGDESTLSFTYGANEKLNKEFFDKLIQNSYITILDNQKTKLTKKKLQNLDYIKDRAQENALRYEYQLLQIDFEIKKIINNFIFKNNNKLARVKEAIKIAKTVGIYEPRQGNPPEYLLFDDGTPLFNFGEKILIQVESNLKNNIDGYKDDIKYQELINDKKNILEGNLTSVKSYADEEIEPKIENLRIANQIEDINIAKQKLFLDEVTDGYISSIKEVNKFKIFNLIIIQLVGIFFSALLVILHRVFKDNS